MYEFVNQTVAVSIQASNKRKVHAYAGRFGASLDVR